MTFAHNRLEFTKPTKRLAFKRSGGICECARVPALMRILDDKPCGVRLSTGNTEYHHIIEDALRPDNSLENAAVLTKTCHAMVTARHSKRIIAQAKRREDRDRNIRPMPRQSLLGTRRSGVTRGFDGVPRWRDSGRRWPSGEPPNAVIAGPVEIVGRVPLIETEPT